MCTVSYIPLEEGFVLTSNRDEDPGRKTNPPGWVALNKGEGFLAPLDAEKGGTWIGTDKKRRAACLLNGGFRKHKRRPPYAMSRGKLIPMAFEAPSFDLFLHQMDYEGIEPFTLLLFENQLTQQLVWDGEYAHHQILVEPKPRLWSSSTLYTPEQHLKKEAYFLEELQKRKKSATTLLELHGSKGESPFLLNRMEVKTVSITQIVLSSESFELSYFKNNNYEKSPVFIPMH